MRAVDAVAWRFRAENERNEERASESRSALTPHARARAPTAPTAWRARCGHTRTGAAAAVPTATAVVGTCCSWPSRDHGPPDGCRSRRRRRRMRARTVTPDVISQMNDNLTDGRKIHFYVRMYRQFRKTTRWRVWCSSRAALTRRVWNELSLPCPCRSSIFWNYSICHACTKSSIFHANRCDETWLFSVRRAGWKNNWIIGNL